MNIKFGLKKQETSLYRVVQMRFDILNFAGVDHGRVWRTDRQTDRQTEPPSAIAQSNDDAKMYLLEWGCCEDAEQHFTQSEW